MTDRDVATTGGATLVGNAPSRIPPGPAHVPTLIFGVPKLSYV